jgi:hypothetical protein
LLMLADMGLTQVSYLRAAILSAGCGKRRVVASETEGRG